MTDEIEQLEHDAVADESRSLTFRSRGPVYGVAGVLFLALDRARRAARRRTGRAALGLAGAGARRDAGLQRAPPDLVVGPPDPRPVARRLEVPRGASGLQQDLRRRAAPRDARRRRRLLLGRRVRLCARVHRSRSARARSAPTTSGSPSASRSRPSRRRSPARSARARSRITSASRGRSRSPRVLRDPALVADRQPEEATLKDLGLKPRDPDRRLADPGADARRLALRDHDHDRPLLAPEPRRRARASRSCC